MEYPIEEPLPDCNKEVFEKGISLGFFDIPKYVAEEICRNMSMATGSKVDWHYVGGRVHIKALPNQATVLRYQTACVLWSQQCFGEEKLHDRALRNLRFFEEAAELVQACGMTKEAAQQVLDYVYDRKAGDPAQEVGGVMSTLAILSFANSINLGQAAFAELDRVKDPEVMEKIREKELAKPIAS